MKTLFVTVGTTKFDDLVKNIFSHQFIDAACSHGYTRWIVQYGLSDLKVLQGLSIEGKIDVDLFPFRSDLAQFYAEADMIISHAGSGSILDALRGPLFINVPYRVPSLVIVANPNLKNNHQMELVQKMGELKVAFPISIHKIMNIFNLINEQDWNLLADIDLETSENILTRLL